jgi:hypothetical protein
MNYKNKLNQIRVVVGLGVKLASEKLADGVTVVEAEEFVPGAELFVVAEDGTKTPAPAGEHVTESGKKVVVDDAGKIVSIEDAETESEGPEVEISVEEAAVPVKMEGEAPIDGSEATPVKDAVEEKIAEVMKKVMMAIEPIIKDVAEMKSKMAEMESKYSKFAKAPAAGKIATMNENTNGSNNVDIVDRFNELKNSLKK